jgi:hypothetical protein
MIGKRENAVYALGATLLSFRSAMYFLAAMLVTSGRNGLFQTASYMSSWWLWGVALSSKLW